MPFLPDKSEIRSVLSLAGPITLMQFGMVAYTTVNTLYMGRIGPEAIAGVGLAGSSIFLLILFGIGTLLGVDTLSSRAFGAGRRDVCAAIVLHALAVALLCSLPLIALAGFAGPAFRAVGISREAADAALAFIKVFRWVVLPALLFTACRQYLQSMNITNPQLVAIVAGNGINIGLGYALVFGRFGLPRLGIQGAAISTLAAEWLMFLITAVAAFREIRASGFRFHGWHRSLFKELLAIGVPAGGQMLVEMAVFTTATFLTGRLGAVPLAAHQIVLNLASITFMVPLGMSFAAAVRVGQGIGRLDAPGAVLSGDTAFTLGVAFMAAAAGLMLLFPKVWLGFYTADAAVLSVGGKLLLIAALFQVFDGTQVALTGALRGLGETRLPMLANLLGHWLIGVPIGVWLAFGLGWGVCGIWTGLCIGIMAVALTLYGVWRSRARKLLESHRFTGAALATEPG
ncbi:MAG: MATE family efflux transporter [Elusimicrobiota bacterium]